MGNTELFSDMALIAELHAPDIVLVPIGDRFTMGTKSASIALNRYLKPKMALLIHFATFGLLAANSDAFAAEMAGLLTKLLLPKEGEALSF